MIGTSSWSLFYIYHFANCKCSTNRINSQNKLLHTTTANESILYYFIHEVQIKSFRRCKLLTTTCEIKILPPPLMVINILNKYSTHDDSKKAT